MNTATADPQRITDPGKIQELLPSLFMAGAVGRGGDFYITVGWGKRILLKQIRALIADGKGGMWLEGDLYQKPDGDDGSEPALMDLVETEDLSTLVNLAHVASIHEVTLEPPMEEARRLLKKLKLESDNVLLEDRMGDGNIELFIHPAPRGRQAAQVKRLKSDLIEILTQEAGR